MITPDLILRFIISYLLGSISGGMVLGKLNGVDIRNLGSGNTGGTNAFRTMGAKFALGVLFIDVIKGFIAVQFVPGLNLTGLIPPAELNLEITALVCGCGAVLGHVYPLYYKFKGGKGAGTMVGVLLAMFPVGLAICLAVWGLILVMSGYVGLSTITAGIALPVSTAMIYPGGLASSFGTFSIIIAFFIIFTHRSNINRMLMGNENRFEKAMIFRRKAAS
jgi:glycerol-3-phosphate acyltransferase PlsY